MTIPRNLSKLAEGADTNGVLGATYGGTGLTSPGTSGNVLTSNGTGWTSSAPAGVPSGSFLNAISNKFTTTGTSGTGSTATITFSSPAGSTLAASYTFPVGDLVYVQGVTPTGYNGLYTITASSSGSVSFASSTTGSQTVAGTILRIPAGYLLGDGSVYSKSSYPALANLIGTPYIPSTPVASYTNASFATGTGQNYLQIVNGNLVCMGTAYNVSTSAVAGAVYYSTDGVNWSSGTGWSPYLYEVYVPPGNNFIAYNGTTYCMGIVGGGGRYCVATSTNLSSWTRQQVGTTGVNANNIVCIACGGSSNVFIVNRTFDSCGPQNDGWWYSTDGATWTQFSAVTGLTDQLMYSVAAYSGGVVTTTNGPKVWYSASGTSGWTDITSNFSGTSNPHYVYYSNGKFFYHAPNGYWSSTTGANGTWTKFAAYNGGNPNPIIWNGSVYVLSPQYSNPIFSPDLSTYGTANYAAAAIGSNIYYKDISTKAIYTWNFNTYNSSTQFPLITLGSGQGFNANYIGGNTNTNAINLYKT